MKKILVILIVTSLFFLIGCSKKEKSKLYIVGTNAEYKPFEYLENNEIVGFDVDLMKEIAKKAEIEIKWEDTSFDGLIPALQAKKIDIIIAAMTITEARKKNVDFSVPYISSSTTFITNENNPIKDMNSIENKKYGVQIGTTQEIVAKKINGAEIILYNNISMGILDLKSKKIDGILVDESVANNFVNTNPGIKIIGKLAGDSKAIAVRKEEKLILNKINTAIIELQKDGTIDTLKKKYSIN